MENWKKHLEENMLSVAEAAGKIESGDTLWLSSTLCIPYDVLEVLADRYEELENVTLLSNMFLKPINLITDPKYKKAFRILSYFPNVLERAAHKSHLVEYVPIPYSYVPYSATEVYKANVVLTEVCEPDEDGYCNIGALGTIFTPQVLKGKYFTKKIAVFNKHQVPAKGPDDVVKVHVSEFDHFCRTDHPLPAIPPSDPEEVDKQIAKHILEFVEDGSSVQIGMGGLANAVAYDLSGKKDINIYTEIVTDALVDLAEQGVIKSIKTGGAFGMPRLYDFLDKTDIVEFGTAESVVSFDAVAQQDNFVGINACLMADVTGQACSEAIGPLQYSSVGGQLDFVKGCNKARLSGKNSVCFLAMRSTYTDKDGTLKSNIVTEFPASSIVTSPRGETMYFVTEYGAADVFGKSINDRVKAMISIAHPDFREELKQKSIALGLVCEDDFR